MSYKLDNIVDKTNDKTIANDNKADDNYQILEASKVLQLALQQMDGIIASEWSISTYLLFNMLFAIVFE